jgi:hypothetical protein
MTDSEHQDNRMAEPASAAVEPTSAANARSARRRWFQYSLRTLLVAATLAGLAMTAWMRFVEPFRQERQLAIMVAELGGRVSTEATGPDWLQSWLPKGCTNVVTGISLSPPVDVSGLFLIWRSPPITNDLMQRIGATHGLRTLDLGHCRLSDDVAPWLARLRTVEKLDLAYTDLTDHGAKHLQDVPGLRCVRLDGTQITDSSLDILATLPDLELLTLNQTRVTSAALEAFRATRPTVELTCVTIEFHDLVSISESDRRLVKSEWGHFLAVNLGNKPVELYSKHPQQVLLFTSVNGEEGCYFINSMGTSWLEPRMLDPHEQSTLTLQVGGGTSMPGVPRRCGLSIGDISIEDFPQGRCVFSDLISFPAE